MLLRLCVGALLLAAWGGANASAQTLSALLPTADGTPQLLFSPTDAITFSWSQDIGAASLRIGAAPGTYNLAEVAVSGTSATVQLNTLGLGTGVYYGVVTNAPGTTLAAIQLAQKADPSLHYSTEILFVVEAQAAPTVIEPRGVLTDGTPTFEWEAVPGVPAYWLLVSSTPFEIEEDALGNTTVVGANTVWQIITPETSVRYGEINPNSPFPTFDVPPLQPGNEYNYTVLNAYSETDAAFISTVFGSVVAFSYENDDALPAPQLNEPADGSSFFGEPTLTFAWDPVAGAKSYTLYLFERIRQDGSEVDAPIWSTITTNTLVDFPARTNLRRGTYVWFVVPSDGQGNGGASQTYLFDYVVDMGEFVISPRAAADNTPLLGFRIDARSLDGGFTPSAPFLPGPEDHSVSDSLVAGFYEFTLTKERFADTTVVLQILPEQRTSQTILMQALPARLLGTVRDETGATVGDAQVTVTNTLTGATETVKALADGTYSLDLQPGTYEVVATQSGFQPSAEQTVSLVAESARTLDLTLTRDAVGVAGRVVNEDGDPVQLATVQATKGAESVQVVTNDGGAFSFSLSSGNWTFLASKEGFVGPGPEVLNLATGDNVQDQVFVLNSRANQVSGTVSEVVTLPDGRTELAPFAGVTVTATPAAGAATSTTTDTNGRYTLNLRNDTYEIQAGSAGYAPSQAVALTLSVSLGVGQSVTGVDFDLVPNTGTITGVVTLPDGTAVDGATVRAGVLAETRTSASGVYTLSVPPGTHTLSVEQAGLIAPTPRTVTLGPDATLSAINFTMTPNAGSIRGRVVSDGQALTGATVTATGPGDPVTTPTDGLGGFALSVEPGTWAITASKAGFQSNAPVTVTVGPGQESADNLLDLTRNAAFVEGTVTDGAAPLRNATVVVTSLADGTTQSTVTRVDGGFSVSVASQAAYRATVTLAGYRSMTQETGTLAPSARASLAFTLAPNPSSVAGTVRQTQGQSLTGVWVVAVQNGTRVDSIQTGVEGRYTLGLSAGTYTLEARRAGYTTTSSSLTLALGQNLTGLDFSLAENFATVSGVVTNGSGGGIGGVLLNLTSARGGGTTRTSDDGSYALTGLIGGTYALTATAEGFADTTRTGLIVGAGRSVTVNLALTPLNGTISGAVTTGGGTPVAGATVTATAADGTRRTTLSTADGAYRLEGLALGTYTLAATRTGFTSAGRPTVTLTGSTLSAVVALDDLTPNTATLRGTVTQASSGAALLDVRVTVSGEAGAGSALTNTNGDYTLTNLVPGTYTATFTQTGFNTQSQSVTLVAESEEVVNVQLTASTTRLSGRVQDQTGPALPFTVPVVLTAGDVQATTRTDASGAFAIEGLASGRTYTLRTDFFREGYSNATATLAVPAGATTAGPVTLVVEAATSILTGNVGTGLATIQVADPADGRIVRVVEARADGGYTVDLLAAGTYTLTPTKSGFTFSPPTASVTLGNADTQTRDFTATANVGIITVTAVAEGSGLSGVTVSLISDDNAVVRSKNSDQGGLALFRDLPAGKTYIAQASRTGFSANPATRSTALNAGDSLNLAFTLTRATATAQGAVRSTEGSALAGATVTARRASTGSVFRATTASNGQYTLASLPGDTYTLTASLAGFLEATRTVTLADGASQTGLDLDLTPINVHLSGQVLFGGSGVAGVTVTAIGPSRFTTTTDGNGQFAFAAVPVSEVADDTTTYEVRISGNEIPAQARLLSLRGDQAGQRVAVPDFVLPSGQLTLVVTDGSQPLPGVVVTLTRPSGESRSATTTADGRFVSANTLVEGTYRATVTRSGYLSPDASDLQYVLATNTEQRTETIPLPYRHTPPKDVFAATATTVQVNAPPGYDASGATATLFFRRDSEEAFTAVTMSRQDTVLSGAIPALFTLEDLRYYVRVTDGGFGYQTVTRTVTPSAAGILTTVRLVPALNGQTLRQGEAYTVDLRLRDGVNASLKSEVASSGGVDWTSSDPALSIAFPDASDPTTATLTATQEGAFTVTITARLGGAVVTKNAQVTVANVPLDKLVVGATQTRLSNTSPGLQFSYTGTDTLGTSVLLGNSLTWRVEPSTAATITADGFLQPTDPTFIGPLTVTATDASTGLEASKDLILFARLDGSQTVTLTNGRGMTLTVPQGALAFSAELSTRPTRLPTPKKYVTPSGANQPYTVSAQGLRITVRSDRALPGDSLAAAATLTLPLSTTFELFEEDPVIGLFDPATVQWDILPATASGGSVVTQQMQALGEYAVLVPNEPLGIRHAAVLPTPFSPEVAPLKIGYLLTTADPPAQVDIRIYNVRGDLVRTLLTRDPQQPGRYGSRTSLREITWDGRADNGTRARNGRYVIEITARDTSGKTTQLIPVVLVK